MLAEENMKKYLLIIILFTTTLIPAVFQIVDEDQAPISNVQIFNSNDGTTSDLYGFFYVEKECNNYKISHIGFQEKYFNPCYSNEIIILKKTSIPNQEIIILGSLNESKLKNTIADIDVLTKTDIINSNKNQLEDILKSLTNINYSGVSSRIRYFQIRGIGEYEQFTGQGGPNYYVGTLIDNFNFSGFGAPISMFDVEQVEIFKGSQSFIFGQNSMAGQIKINTKNPNPFMETMLSLELGSFNKRNIHLVYNQPVSKNISIRIATSKNIDDGFIYNDYLNDYSNKRDELISNFKILWSRSYKKDNNLEILFHLLNYDLDNNYDRWSSTNFSNFSDFTSYSDFNGLPNQKSLDALKGRSYSLKLDYKKENFSLTSTLTTDDINLEHNYDGDWSNPNHWEGYYYPFSQSEKRNRISDIFETKISSSIQNNTLTIGFFTKNLKESDIANGFIFDLLDYTYVSSFSSDYDINYLSYYIQNSYKINENSYLIFNIRQDNYKNKYQSISTVSDYYGNSNSTSNPTYNKKESILSGRFGLRINNYYVSISRGHKAGGFNQNPFISDLNRIYKPEYSNNLEFGYKNTLGPLNLELNLFHMKRENLHVNISDQAAEDNPLSFYFFTSNINRGTNQGIDLNMNLKLNKNTSIFLNTGILKTIRDSFSYPKSIDEDNNIVYEIIPERQQARAPGYTINAGIESYLTNQFFIRIEAIAKDKYYYFDNEDQMSKAYKIINLNTRYKFNSKLSINFSIQNILNQKYSIHGFYFSLDGYMPAQLYESPGDPRSYGIKLDYKF